MYFCCDQSGKIPRVRRLLNEENRAGDFGSKQPLCVLWSEAATSRDTLVPSPDLFVSSPMTTTATFFRKSASALIFRWHINTLSHTDRSWNPESCRKTRLGIPCGPAIQSLRFERPS